MTYRDWEVPTPANERNTRMGDFSDLFSIDPQKKAKQAGQVEAYYRDLLQLDQNKVAKNVLQVEQFVNTQSKFPWRMMIFSMDDVKVLIEFFRHHVVNIKRGAKVLLERIEDHEGLMTTSSVVDFTQI